MNNKIPDNFYEVGDLSLSIFTTHLGLLYAGSDRLYVITGNTRSPDKLRQLTRGCLVPKINASISALITCHLHSTALRSRDTNFIKYPT
ncbi:hypothetical protein [Nostoc sp.]|uniref:hypothetical protein n=1 Tax=Nostoc sp. TaxID=1180 RepID=UPI002FFD2AF0